MQSVPYTPSFPSFWGCCCLPPLPPPPPTITSRAGGQVHACTCGTGQMQSDDSTWAPAPGWQPVQELSAGQWPSSPRHKCSRDVSCQTWVSLRYSRDVSSQTIVSLRYSRDVSSQTIVSLGYSRDVASQTIVSLSVSAAATAEQFQVKLWSLWVFGALITSV